MESTGPKVRFVRCPKCANIIAEFADIPVYKCGACGTTLQAKYGSQNLSDISSLNNGSASSGKEMIASSLELDNRVEQAAPPSYVPETNAAINCDEKGESSELGDRSIEEGEPDREPNISLALESETNLNEEVEESLKLTPQGHGSPMPIDKVEELVEPRMQEDTIDRGGGGVGGNSVRSTTGSFHAYYDGSVSSADDEERVPRKHLLLSKRTIRHKKVLDSIDNTEKKAGEGGNVVTTDMGSRLQARNLTVKSDLIRDNLSSKCDVRAAQRETSLGSEDFHSVQNWMEPEDDAPSRSRSRELIVRGDSLDSQNDNPSHKLRYLKADQMKILKKVDELRDELSELFGQAVEGKITTLLKSIREEDLTRDLDSNLRHPRKTMARRFHFSSAPLSGQPHSSSLQCHPSKAMSPHPRTDSSLVLQCLEPRVQDSESDKLHCKEKRQLIKRHCRPIAGGAPFVVCCKCLNLLQVPADFLVSRKKFHKLQCGACSQVLLYSFRARAPMVPRTPIEVRHPPSEVEHSTDTDTGHERTASNFNDGPHGDPFSYSGEHGLSYAISDSSEAEPVLNVSRNSSDLSEKQSAMQVKASQLHRLLGYSSASELLRRRSDVDEGYQSTEPATPRFFGPKEGETGYEPKGKGIRTPPYGHLEAGTSSNFVERRGEDGSPIRSKAVRSVSPLRGLLKKGMRELNHGLESVKLKIHSNAKTTPNPYARNPNER